MPECSVKSPITGNTCTMGNGHFGPHKVGGPYNTTEVLVTKCTGRSCNYHPNSKPGPCGTRLKWKECIHCGHKLRVYEVQQ